MATTIKQYYDELAPKYDDSRFANTYGKYIHQQEDRILQKYLSGSDITRNLDVACGTGRFLSYATYGVDISEAMLVAAQAKHPKAKLLLGSAEKLPFTQDTFLNVTAFHLLMHLDNKQLAKILKEVGRVTQQGGRFIFDIPSEKRRILTRYKNDSWHGANQIKTSELKVLIEDNWQLEAYYGVVFFPIHRIPTALRKWFVRLDSFLCRSFLKEYSSHLIYVLKKI